MTHGGGEEGHRAELERKYQYLLDKSSPMIGMRWAAFAVCLFLYIFARVATEAFYIVTYGLGIYLLSIFRLYLTSVRPEEENALDGGLQLVTLRNIDLSHVDCLNSSFSSTAARCLVTTFS